MYSGKYRAICTKRLVSKKTPLEREELEISRLTLRFNKAWLAETNPSHPEIAVAMSEYLSLTEAAKLNDNSE